LRARPRSFQRSGCERKHLIWLVSTCTERGSPGSQASRRRK
jgi:hypothetical protein